MIDCKSEFKVDFEVEPEKLTRAQKREQKRAQKQQATIEAREAALIHTGLTVAIGLVLASITLFVLFS